MADFNAMLNSTTPPVPTSPRDMIMTMPAEVEQKQQTALNELKQKEQASMAKQDTLYADAMKKYNDAMSNVKPVAEPNLQNPPAAPNTKMQDPTQVLGSLGTILAIFGSMKTRAPMTSALNSMAAAMKGFHQGDQEAIKANTEKWQNDFKTALAQNQIEMQKYMNALEKNKFDMAGAQADLRVLAVEMQDKQMHDAVDQGDYTKQSAILSGRLNAGMKGAETLAKMDETRQAHADAMMAHKDSAAATAAYRDREATDREQAQKDRLAMFDAQHGTNLAGVKTGADNSGPVPKDEKVVKEIDDLKEFVRKNPSVVGSLGWARQIAETISGTLTENAPLVKDLPIPESVKGMAPLHQEFTSKLAKLQLDMRDALIKGGRSAKWQMDYIDEIVRGKGIWDTQQGTLDALDMLGGLYGGNAPHGQSASGKITTGHPEPPPGFVLQQ